MPRLPVVSLGLLACLGGAVLLPAPAAAGPWTLPEGQLVVGLGYDFQIANREWFGLEGEPSARRVFPLNGQYTASSLTLGLRAGFTDQLEFELQVPVRLVSYLSDPVLLLEEPVSEAMRGLDFYQENIIDLGRDAVGVGDIVLAGRWGWSRWPVATSTELRIKTPTGYRGPAGTFGESPESAEVFAADPTRFVNPDNVRDDVVLGDGQLDIALIQHVGAAFDTRTFVRAELGYNLRLGGAGDQLLAALRAGQLLGDVILLYAGAQLALTVENGRFIGVSVAAQDPGLPAADYGGLTNILLRELRLQYDAVQVSGGAILRILPNVELNAGYFRTVWGRNTAAVQGFAISLAVRTGYLPDRD
jgi:hypothetical protein